MDQDPDTEREWRRLPWEGAPDDVIGGVLPLECVLARNDHLVIVVTEAVAYRDGVEFPLRLRARRRPGMSRAQWSDISRGMWGYDAFGWHEDEPADGPDRLAETGARHPDELLRFGIRFADGTQVTTVDERATGPDAWHSPRPDGPVLVLDERGGGGSGETIDSDRTLWLWPLPVPRPFELAVEWPLLGVDLTFTSLDGEAIVAAAARARPFWDD